MKNGTQMKSLRFLIITLCLMIFTGCGYKPSSYYAKKELGKNVFVKLSVDIKDPKNSVLIKDAMNELLVYKLGKRLVYDEAKAHTIMNVKLNSVGMSELSQNEDGYTKLYKASVSISVKYTNQEKKTKSFSVSGTYDFSIDDVNGTISETKRFEAIKNAADKALDEMISKMAVQTFEKKNVKKSY